MKQCAECSRQKKADNCIECYRKTKKKLNRRERQIADIKHIVAGTGFLRVGKDIQDYIKMNNV